MRALAAPGTTLIQVNGADLLPASVRVRKGVCRPRKLANSLVEERPIMSVMSISGSRVARQWAIAMYSLLATVLLAMWHFYS